MGRRRKAWLWAKTGRRPGRQGFYVRFYDYYRDEDGNRQRIHRSKHFLKIADARQWCKEFNARADLDELGRVAAVSLEDATREFLAGCSALSDNTLISYTTALGFLDSIVGSDAVVSGIDGRDIDGLIARQLRSTRASTVAKHIRSINRFFKWCVERKYTASNPVVAATSKPKGKHARQHPPFTEDGLAALIRALDTEDRRIAVWIAMTAGLDRSVITRLRGEQVDIDAACIRLIRPKTGRAVVVPIHRHLVPLLAARLRERDPSEHLLRGLQRQESNRDWFRRACVAAKMPKGFVFRDLRAVASSRLQNLGRASLTEAQNLLGHASPETTAAHYTMPSPDTRSKLDGLDLPAFPGSGKSTTD